MVVIEAKVDHVENSVGVHRFEHLHRVLLPDDVIFCGDFFEKSKKSAFKKFELTSPVELRLPDSELVRILPLLPLPIVWKHGREIAEIDLLFNHRMKLWRLISI